MHPDHPVMHFTVESPWYLLLLPVWVGLGWVSLQVRLPLGHVSSEKKRWLVLRAFLPGWGTALLGALASVALSEPIVHSRTKSPSLPDIWVLWDISRSMRLTDLSPTRQSFAMEKMKSAFESISYRRAGLIAFGAGAYAVLPLTADREAFFFALGQVSRIDPGEGTNLSAAVETALALAEGPSHLLIVSDGAHNVPGSTDLRALGEIARQRGMIIHSTFIGKENEQTFPQALRVLSELTGGIYRENEINLRDLLRPAETQVPYMLAPLLWTAIIGGGILMLAGMAIGGWFSVLTA